MDFILGFNQETGCVTKLNNSFAGEMVFEKEYKTKTIKSIGTAACQNGTLTSLDLRKTEIIIIDEGAFLRSAIRTLYLPESLTTIRYNAFGLTYIEYVNITANVETMDTCAWNQIPNLKAFNVDKGNQYFSSNQGFLFDKEGKILLGVPRSLEYQTDIPNYQTLEGIGKCAFTCSNLKNFISPKSLNIIDVYAFHVTTKIRMINLKNSSITSIPNRAFRTTSVQYIIFPSNLQNITMHAISYAWNLRTLVIPMNVTNIEDSSIEECEKLERVFYFGTNDHSSNSIFTNNNKKLKVYVSSEYPSQYFGNIRSNFIWPYVYPFASCRMFPFHISNNALFASILLYCNSE